MEDKKYIKEELSHEGGNLEPQTDEQKAKINKGFLTRNIITFAIGAAALLVIGGSILGAYILKGDTEPDEDVMEEGKEDETEDDNVRENEEEEMNNQNQDIEEENGEDEEVAEDPYEGWQTYSSQIYTGLTVRYPAGWILEEEVVYDLDGFVFRFTNGDITWEVQPEYQGQLATPPEAGSDFLNNCCFGTVINLMNTLLDS